MLAAILCGISARAQAGVAVSPLMQEISVKPGQTARFRVTVTNNVRGQRAKTETVHLALVDVAVSEDGRLSFTEPGSLPRSASRWIKLSATEVVVKPGESTIVEGSVTAPHRASGEFYSAVMVTLATHGKTDKGVSVTYRIASGLFVTVRGRSFPKRAEITRCEVVWPELDETATMAPSQSLSESAALPPARVAVVLKNTGQARFDASGRVRMLDAQFRTVFLAPLTSSRPCVFGGDSRLFEALLDKPVAAGKYTLHVEMDYQSRWGKARRRQVLEITAEQAHRLEKTAMRARQGQGGLIEVNPEKVACEVVAGSFRCLSVMVRNAGEDRVPCSAVLTARDDGSSHTAWWSVEPAKFELPPRAQRSLVLLLRVPAETAPGKYAFSLTIKAAQTALPEAELTVPVDVDVKAAR